MRLLLLQKCFHVVRALRELHKHKLVHHEQRGYDGYRLTNLGYDFLALSALSKRGSVVRVGNRLGVGKEADVFHGENEDGQIVCLKVHLSAQKDSMIALLCRSLTPLERTDARWGG